MFKKNLIFLLTLILTIVMGCSESTKNEDKEPPVDDARLLKPEKLVNSNELFGFDLFKEINETQRDSNIFISPLSVSMALGMTLNGAAGQTKEEMIQTLEFSGLSMDEINATYRHLIDLLLSADPEVIFEIANSIWYKEGFPVEENFLEINQKYFDSEVREADFGAPETVEAINGWIADKTHDKIREMLDAIPGNTVMFLINAIYYHANWTYQFDKEKTKDARFSKAEGVTVPCKLMVQKNEFQYLATDDFQAVNLPYGDEKYSMAVFLPGLEKNIDEFISEFSTEKWNEWKNGFQPDSGFVELPKFKTEYKLKMNDVLKSLGMVSAFGGAANFSLINPDRELFISRVLHQTFIDVNEEGTEAAAATIVEIRETAEDPYFYMTANRPFFFIIHEKETGAILFMGKIVEPEYEA